MPSSRTGTARADASALAIAARLVSSRAEVLASAPPGGEAARGLSAHADEAISALAGVASSSASGRWAVVALGAYGCGRLLPCSDIDLLVLAERDPRALRELVDGVFYPLWDAGLTVGHQVRSRREHLASCREDIEILTASLTGRVVAGDAAFGASVLAEVAAAARRQRRALLRRSGSRAAPLSPWSLEPDLKHGAGGQRDIDELVWMAAILAGAPGHDASRLVTLGLLTAEEERSLAAAQEALTAARWEAHRLAGRAENVLTPEIAEDSRIDAEALHAALGDVWLTHRRVRRRLDREVRVGPPCEDALAPGELLALVGRGSASVPYLEEAAWSGRLDALLPGIRGLMVARRPGFGHSLTVGAHCLLAAALAADIAAGRSTVSPKPPTLEPASALPAIVAALAHDAGKAQPGPGHAERGGPLAAALARRLGLDEGAAEDAGTLVRLHLLLAETATGEDIDDEDTLLSVAGRIGESRLVPPLHVLTAADSLATGAELWTPWHATLVGRLAARLDDALSPHVDGAGLATRAVAVRAAVLESLPAAEAEDVRRFAEAVPLRYLASRSPREVVAHARLVAGLPSAGAPPVATLVSPGPVPDSFQVAVTAFDQADLFSRIAGAFSLAGLDIMSAEAHALPGGVVLDVFTVTSATRAVPASATWSTLDRRLRAAIADRLDLRARLAGRASAYDRGGTPGIAPRIDVDTRPGYVTAIEVRAQDRVGLLSAIAAEIAAEGLDIRWANVTSRAGIARDVFHVVDADGQAPNDPGVLGHLCMRIRGVA